MKEICVLRVSKNCLTTLKVYYDYFHYICMFVSDCQYKHVSGRCLGKPEASDPSELELQAVVSLQLWGLGTELLSST